MNKKFIYITNADNSIQFRFSSHSNRRTVESTFTFNMKFTFLHCVCFFTSSSSKCWELFGVAELNVPGFTFTFHWTLNSIPLAAKENLNHSRFYLNDFLDVILLFHWTFNPFPCELSDNMLNFSAPKFSSMNSGFESFKWTTLTDCKAWNRLRKWVKARKLFTPQFDTPSTRESEHNAFFNFNRSFTFSSLSLWLLDGGSRRRKNFVKNLPILF